jgi:hypothetical protein
MSSHLKRKFLKKWFSPQISSKPPSAQETEHRKKEGEKVLKKREKEKKEKEEEKEKLQESLQINGKSIFWEEKNSSTSKNIFYVIFSPFIMPFQKPFPKSLRKLAILDHPLTWQYTWLELYPFS